MIRGIYIALVLEILLSTGLFSQKIDELSFAIGYNSLRSEWDNMITPNYRGVRIGYISIKGTKKINSLLDLELETGYYTSKIQENVFGSKIVFVSGKFMSFNHLSIGSGFNLYPFGKKRRAYLHGSLRAEYLMFYKDITVIFSSGEKQLFLGPVVDQFNRLNLWLNGGIGFRITEKIFMEYEINYQFTPQTRDPNLTIKNLALGVSLGFLIQKFNPKGIVENE